MFYTEKSMNKSNNNNRRKAHPQLHYTYNAPKLILYPFVGSLAMAFIVALTSAAPFPSANNVTPANRGGNPNFTENISSDGLKYSSAVLPNRRNNNVNNRSNSGDSSVNHDVVDIMDV